MSTEQDTHWDAASHYKRDHKEFMQVTLPHLINHSAMQREWDYNQLAFSSNVRAVGNNHFIVDRYSGVPPQVNIMRRAAFALASNDIAYHVLQNLDPRMEWLDVVNTAVNNAWNSNQRFYRFDVRSLDAHYFFILTPKEITVLVYPVGEDLVTAAEAVHHINSEINAHIVENFAERIYIEG